MAYKGPAAEKETRSLLKDSAALASLDSSVPASGKILHLGCGRGHLPHVHGAMPMWQEFGKAQLRYRQTEPDGQVQGHYPVSSGSV